MGSAFGGVGASRDVLELVSARRSWVEFRWRSKWRSRVDVKVRVCGGVRGRGRVRGVQVKVSLQFGRRGQVSQTSVFKFWSGQIKRRSSKRPPFNVGGGSLTPFTPECLRYPDHSSLDVVVFRRSDLTSGQEVCQTTTFWLRSLWRADATLVVTTLWD